MASAAAPARPFGSRRGGPPAGAADDARAWGDLCRQAQSVSAAVLSEWRARLLSGLRAAQPAIRRGCQTVLERLRAAVARRQTRAVLAPVERPAPAHPALRSWADELRAAMVRVLAYLGALGVLALGAAELMADPPILLANLEPVARSPWIEASRPHAAFVLTLPELSESERRYVIQRHADGGGRKDILTWGEADAEGPFARVEIYRPGSEPETFADAMTEIAARLLRQDITDDVKPAGTLPSKFGAVALVDFALRRQDGERRCLGFVRPFHQVRMQIAGWYCNAGPEVVDRGTVSCALDRLTALSSGNDPALAQRFAQAELNRDFCRQNDPILYATPRRGETLGSARLRGRQTR